MSKILAQRMHELMDKYHITQAQLAARTGTTQPTISKYLSGNREPASNTLANIATALHTTSEYLLGLPESSIETPFGTIREYCLRHGGDLSEKEVRELIMVLLAARGKDNQN